MHDVRRLGLVGLEKLAPRRDRVKEVRDLDPRAPVGCGRWLIHDERRGRGRRRRFRAGGPDGDAR